MSQYEQIRCKMREIYDRVDASWGKNVSGVTYKVSEFNAALNYYGYFELKKQLEDLSHEDIKSLE